MGGQGATRRAEFRQLSVNWHSGIRLRPTEQVNSLASPGFIRRTFAVILDRAMRLAEVEQGLEELIPLHLAESWDPVGRQLGRGDQTIKRLMLTIDATESVVEEAIAAQVDLLLAYHPVLLHPPKRWNGDDPDVRPLTRAAAHEMAIWGAIQLT